MWIEATEGAKFSTGVLTELRNRGVRDVLIVCRDGLTGLPDAIASMLRPIYTAPDLEAAVLALAAFKDSDPRKRCPASAEVMKRSWEEVHPVTGTVQASRSRRVAATTPTASVCSLSRTR